MATCIYCGQAFTPPKPTTTMCAGCWWTGRHHEAQRPALLDGLRAVLGVDRADIDHTGGGCFVLAIRFTDKRYLVATVAYQENGSGEWFCDAGLPAAGEPWALGIFPDEDAFMDGDAHEAEPMRLPLTDAELVEAVREIAAKGAGR